MVSFLGLKGLKQIGLLSLVLSDKKIYNTRMNKSIISLFITITLSLPAAAQTGKAIPSTLKAIQGGKAAVEVLPQLYQTAVPALSRAAVAERAALFSVRYQNKISRINELKSVARPVELDPSYTKTPSLTVALSPRKALVTEGNAALSSQLELKMAQTQRNDILYKWGELLVQNGMVSAVFPAKISADQDVVILKMKNQLFWIETPNSTDIKDLTPLEIFTYTESLHKVLSILPELTLETIWAQSPEKIAIFSYLRGNFEEAFAQLSAANDAFLTIKPTRNWLLQESQQTRLVRQNYQLASANTAAAAAQLLQFMATEDNVLFRRAFAAFRQLSSMKTRDMNISGKFNELWQKKPIEI